MEKEIDWNELLQDHPVFSPSERAAGKTDPSFELSLGSLVDLTEANHSHDGQAPSGRRQVMAIKDSELIVAVGSEIRMATLAESPTKLGRSARKSYKTLSTPSVQFEIRQIVLNSHGKLLAVAGAYQVVVVVLPHSGFTKLKPETVDCKSLLIGQFYHAESTTAPIAKIDWHPWGEGGTTLLVMTTDGILREYDIAVDAEEPQQMLSLVPEKRKNRFAADGDAECEAASFTLGKGRADWGPLSIYTIMKSGDIYAICPYMPRNAAIPSSYIHALECFVAAKQEFLSRSQGEGTSSNTLASMYDHQHKYVNALLRQMPPGTAFPSISRPVSIHPPNTVKSPPVRQGPFLLQPSPRTLHGSEGGDATDIVYLAFGNDAEETDSETKRLGIVLAAFQDGRVDVYLDVEKIEARWDHKHADKDLPMFAVYETIDLGIVNMLSKATTSKTDSSLLDLIQGNHPVLSPDPVREDAVYIHHGFGAHALQLGPMLRSLATALHGAVDDESGSLLEQALRECKYTEVQPLMTTFSIERKSSNPIVSLTLPNDVYLTYSIFILTSAMRITVFPLTLRSESPYPSTSELPSVPDQTRSATPPFASADFSKVSFLSAEPFSIPDVLKRNAGLPSNPRLALPRNAGGELVLTDDVLRNFRATVEHLTAQVHEVLFAHRRSEARVELQRAEFGRQREKCAQMFRIIDQLKNTRQSNTKAKLEAVQNNQQALLTRLDRILRSLMAKASPELSESETKWFEELGRMKEEVVGSSKYDERSLSARSRALRQEVDRLLPKLKELNELEHERKKKLAERGEVLGVSQAFELGKRSTQERTRIDSIENEVLRLAARLDMTLGQPPQLRDKPIAS
ncbi:hypothetical protein WOLCODRAFT_100221 [Wolfiporia cocos MD-104 SS10]|uniref:Nucleoporin Nup82 n=1 Tax=Wolfiporia cocos (strain MD-104) TaxID=742152 RepID=A0A2H3JR59_WOLCO|nr:hypothetical protein WOLCODRAFT_100221 [Wolfiporia cocos MD-104 SS10]